MKYKVQDLSGGPQLITIGEMAKKSGVSASAIRGYEKLGLLRQYGIPVIREGSFRYFNPEDSWKLAQIKASRVANRNEILASQGGNHDH